MTADPWTDVDPGPQPSRVHPFPGNVLVHVQNMGDGGSDEDSPAQVAAEVRHPTTDLDHAMILTSMTGEDVTMYRAKSAGGFDSVTEPCHRPVLDLDYRAELIPSSTPGHFHLVLDTRVPWSSYLAVLEAMAAAQLLEPGYVSAARERGHTGVRVPWFPKGSEHPEPPADAPRRCWKCEEVFPPDLIVRRYELCPTCHVENADQLDAHYRESDDLLAAEAPAPAELTPAPAA